MKTINVCCVLLLSVLIVVGCGDEVTDFALFFPKEYDSVYCFVPDSREPWKQDTTIFFSRDKLELINLYNWDNNTNRGVIVLGWGSLDVIFTYMKCDTVSVFLFDRHVVDTYSWDEVVQKYYVLQRYDFSKEDLEKLGCQIPYPPTQDMADMHMFPPYCSYVE